MSSFNWNW